MQDRSKKLLIRVFVDFIIIAVITVPFIVYFKIYDKLSSDISAYVLMGIFFGELIVMQFAVVIRQTFGKFGFSFDFIERPIPWENVVVRDQRIRLEKIFFRYVLVFWFPFDMLMMIFFIFWVKSRESVEIKQDGWEILKKAGIDDPDKY